MARITFAEVDSLPDALDQVGFEFLLGTIPGSGSTRHLTLKCTSVTIPGFSNEAFEQPLHGHVLNFRGRKTYPRTLSINYIEDSTFATLDAMRSWHEVVAGTDSNDSGGLIDEYAVDARLIVYNTAGEVAASHIIERLFPQDVPDITLTGDSSAVVQVPVTFKYNRFRSENLRML